jgi:RNA polymerase-binding transcription factor DksA
MAAMTGEKKTKTEKAVKKVPSKSAGKTPGKTANKSKTTSKTPGKTASKTSGKTVSKTPVKTASMASGKTTSKTSVRTPSKPPVKTTIREKTPQFSMSKAEWDAFIEKMENLLQEEKSEIINTLIANNNDFKEIVDGMDPKDFADIASDDIDRKMIEMLGSQELKRLKLIESAQTRIKQGKYGHCIKCDRPIPPERLEAIPYALMCIECKSEEERRNR